MNVLYDVIAVWLVLVTYLASNLDVIYSTLYITVEHHIVSKYL